MASDKATARVLRALRLYCDGASNKQVSESSKLSAETVRNALRRLVNDGVVRKFTKGGVRGRGAELRLFSAFPPRTKANSNLIDALQLFMWSNASYTPSELAKKMHLTYNATDDILKRLIELSLIDYRERSAAEPLYFWTEIDWYELNHDAPCAV